MAELRILILLLPSGTAHAQKRNLGVVISSVHIGNEALNNFNPGLGNGMRRGCRTGMERHLEGDVFHNCCDEVSPFAIVGTHRHLFIPGPAKIRGEVSTGLGYDRTLAVELKDDYGIPNIGGDLPLPSAKIFCTLRGYQVPVDHVSAEQGHHCHLEFLIRAQVLSCCR